MSEKNEKDEGEFVHDLIFLRSCDARGLAHGGFVWPDSAGEMVTAPDWDPEPKCGGGLHGLADGLGDWGLLKSPGEVDARWYVCGGIRSEAVEIDGGKIKVPRCRVLYVGDFAGAMGLISPAMTAAILRTVDERTKAAKIEPGSRSHNAGGAATASGYRGAATASGDSGAATASGTSGAATASGDSGAATASGTRGAATASGYSGAATASGKHGVALACGIYSRAKVADGCLLVLVERDPEDGRILHHFAAMAGTNGVKPGRWYTLTDGNLTEVKP